MTAVDYVFGIDGGGSGCRVAVCAPDGQQVAATLGGPANYFTDPEATLRNVQQAINDAITQLPSSTYDPAKCVVHVGLAGVIDDRDKAAVASAMPFARVSVTDDGVTSVAGALGDADGVLISVGTGSFVAAQRGGVQRFVGGWGAQLGDQASGCWLGMQALRRAMLAADGLTVQSDLTKQVMIDCGGTRSAVLQFVWGAQPTDYAALAPKIIGAAEAGDGHGVEMMKEGGTYLMACLRAFELSDSDMLCLTGGIGPQYADYLDDAVRARIQSPLGSALDGAVHLARKLL